MRRAPLTITCCARASSSCWRSRIPISGCSRSNSAATRSTRACTPVARSPRPFRSSPCTTVASSIVDVADPTRAGQDLFVLSKGHAVAALASIYAELGYFDRSVLRNSRSYTSILNGHPGPVLPGIQIATGPMGQGLAVAQGFAIAGRVSPRFDAYALCGDGEMQEGPIWEAVMFAGQKHLDNLCVMVDRNNGQLDHGQPDDLPDARSRGGLPDRSTGKCTASTPRSTTACTRRSSSSGSGRATASRPRSSAMARKATERFPTF